MNEWCEWHVAIIEEGEDRDITIMHPGCNFTVTVDQGYSFSYHCEIGFEIENCGYDTLLHDQGPGWYRVRMRHVTINGLDFSSEIDVEYEVEELVPREQVKREVEVAQHSTWPYDPPGHSGMH